MVSAFNLSEEIALAIWKIHVEAAPGLLKRYGLELSNRYDGEEEEENENRMFRDVMRSALKRGISYVEAVENKKQYADVMAELTEEEEEQEEKPSRIFPLVC